MSQDSATAGVVNVWLDGCVGVAELSRAEKFNCLSTEVWGALGDALRAFEAEAAVRSVLIVAAGEHFCTGADLDEVLAASADRGTLCEFLDCGSGVMSRFEESPLPIVCAVQGLALAGGLELVLASDVVFAAQSARLGDQHARFGLIPGWGGSQRLPRIIGLRRAMDLLLTARWLGAEEARDLGLVNFVVADERLRDEALSYCQAFAGRSRSGIAAMKRLARQAMAGPLPEGIAFERSLAVDSLLGEDAAEGLAAFQARREPNFP